MAQRVEGRERRAQVVRHGVAECFELAVDRSQGDGPLLDERFELRAVTPELLLGAVELSEDRDLGAEDRGHDRGEDEVHRTEVVAPAHVRLGLVEGCHENDRRQLGAGPLPDQLRGLEPVHDGHPDVEEDHGEFVAQQLPQRVGSGRGLDQVLVEGREDRAQREALGGVVVDHQHVDLRLGRRGRRSLVVLPAGPCHHLVFRNRFTPSRTRS